MAYVRLSSDKNAIEDILVDVDTYVDTDQKFFEVIASLGDNKCSFRTTFAEMDASINPEEIIQLMINTASYNLLKRLQDLNGWCTI